MQQIFVSPSNRQSPIPPTASQQDALCLECRYPLRGLINSRCPECGRAFDPTDSTTMYLRPSMGQLGQELLRPFGKTTNRLAILATAVMVLAPFIVPSTLWVILWSNGKLLWIAIIARWSARIMLRLTTAAIYRYSLTSLPGGWRRFIPVPALFATTTFFILGNFCAYPLLLINHPAMEYAAAHAPTIGNKAEIRIGLFQANAFSPTGFGARFWLGPVGFAHSEAIVPGNQYFHYTHLVGPWYTTTDSLTDPGDRRYKLFSLE